MLRTCKWQKGPHVCVGLLWNCTLAVLFFYMCVYKESKVCKVSVYSCAQLVWPCASEWLCAQPMWVFSILCAKARIGLSVTVKWGEEGDDMCREVEREKERVWKRWMREHKRRAEEQKRRRTKVKFGGMKRNFCSFFEREMQMEMQHKCLSNSWWQFISETAE